MHARDDPAADPDQDRDPVAAPGAEHHPHPRHGRKARRSMRQGGLPVVPLPKVHPLPGSACSHARRGAWSRSRSAPPDSGGSCANRPALRRLWQQPLARSPVTGMPQRRRSAQPTLACAPDRAIRKDAGQATHVLPQHRIGARRAENSRPQSAILDPEVIAAAGSGDQESRSATLPSHRAPPSGARLGAPPHNSRKPDRRKACPKSHQAETTELAHR